MLYAYYLLHIFYVISWGNLSKRKEQTDNQQFWTSKIKNYITTYQYTKS